MNTTNYLVKQKQQRTGSTVTTTVSYNYSKTADKEKFEDAKILVNRVEEKNNKLKQFREELSALLKEFEAISFKKYPRTSGFIFAGFKNGKIKIGTSKCNPPDFFVEEVGKLIAVRRAVNKPTEDLEKFLIDYFDVLGI